jgi:hypothetical protein
VSGQDHSQLRAVEWVRSIALEGSDMVSFGEVQSYNTHNTITRTFVFKWFQ